VFKVLATDAHNLQGRAPVLTEGVAAAARVVGEQAAQDLVNRNPRAILQLAAAPGG
jgi:protein-tyrosine phosphatase